MPDERSQDDLLAHANDPILDDRQLLAVAACADVILVTPEGKRPDMNVVAKQCGVHVQTVRDWRRDPVFQEQLKRELMSRSNYFADIPLSKKRNRVEELQRLYNATPDEAEEITYDRFGSVVNRKRRIFTLDKANILKHIQQEVEPVGLRVATATKPDGTQATVIEVGGSSLPWATGPIQEGASNADDV